MPMVMISVIDIPKNEQHTHAHRLLRECLKPLKIAYSEELITVGEHGKPYLPDFPDVHFNLSHADGIAACIVSDRPCGIDCERVRPYRENVMRRVFSESEQNMFYSLPEEERDLLFFRLWTLKESYIKAIGIGLSFPMSRAEFAFEGDRPVSNVPDWKFRQHIIRGEFVVSICEQIVNNSPEY